MMMAAIHGSIVISIARPRSLASVKPIIPPQDEAGMSGQNKQGEVAREQKRIATFAFAERAPVMQERERGQRHGQTGGPNVGVGTDKAEMPIIKKMASAAW